MAKAGYDFTTRTELKSVKIFDKRYGLSPTQKKLQKQGYFIPNSRAKIGYKSVEPIRISGKGKVKVADACHIIVEESKDSEEGEMSSVFYLITSLAAHLSGFQRLNTPMVEDKSPCSTSNSTRLSAFQRLNATSKKVQSTSPTLDT